MFPLDVQTPTDESYDPSADIEAARKKVVLEEGQQIVMCNACGHWWVVGRGEYQPYGGGDRRYPRIASCPHCDLPAKEE